MQRDSDLLITANYGDCYTELKRQLRLFEQIVGPALPGSGGEAKLVVWGNICEYLNRREVHELTRTLYARNRGIQITATPRDGRWDTWLARLNGSAPTRGYHYDFHAKWTGVDKKQ